MSEVTRILNAIQRGEEDGTDLFPLIYKEMRRLARQQMGRERPDHTLQPTALVNEAYLRLVGAGPVQWENQGHFFGAAAEAMRRILVDHARGKGALKRGGHIRHEDLEDTIPALEVALDSPGDLLALSEALDELAKEEPAKAQLVKLRYFAGLSLAEAGAAIGISRATANRHWDFARAWLHESLTRRAKEKP